jgi:hypothetical protein
MRAYKYLFVSYTKRRLYIKQIDLEDSIAIFRNVFRVMVVKISSKRSK